jgi:hypothetical protein
MSKVTVYIVFRQTRHHTSSGNEFIGVFFDRASAEQFIVERINSFLYYIETYQQPQPGCQHQVFC